MSAIHLSFDSNGGRNPAIILEFPDCANQSVSLFFGESSGGTLLTFDSDMHFKKTLPVGKKLWIAFFVPLQSTYFGTALGSDAGRNSMVVHCVCLRVLQEKKPFSFLESFITKRKQEQNNGPIFFEERNTVDFLSIDGIVLANTRTYQLPEKMFQRFFPNNEFR